MTEVELATRLHRDLTALATEAGWSVTATTGQSYGSYTDAIVDAKTDAGVTGDLADATAAQLATVRSASLQACLVRLELHFAAYADLKVGERDEKLSQLRGALASARANIGGGGATATSFRLRRGKQVDYTTSTGDEVEE